MSDKTSSEFGALKNLIPQGLGLDVLEIWRSTGTTILTERGLYPEPKVSAASRASALDRLDARAQAELVAAIIAAAADHARRES